MVFVKLILTDFYELCNIPIRSLDKDMNILFEAGYLSFYDDIFNNLDLINLRLNLDRDSPFLITLKNNISFYLLPNFFGINKNIDFLIGPLYLKEDIKDFNLTLKHNKIPIKTKECLKYYNSVFKIILNEKLKDASKNLYSPYVKRAIDSIEKNYSKEIKIESLCRDFKINKSYFCTLFKNETGKTFINFLNNYRVEKSKDLLKDSSISLLDIAHTVGFNNQSYYCTVFKKFTHLTPLKYREELYKKGL